MISQKIKFCVKSAQKCVKNGKNVLEKLKKIVLKIFKKLC